MDGRITNEHLVSCKFYILKKQDMTVSLSFEDMENIFQDQDLRISSEKSELNILSINDDVYGKADYGFELCEVSGLCCGPNRGEGTPIGSAELQTIIIM